MRLIDADRLLDRCKFYHLPNGDLAVPIVDVLHAPTIEPERNGEWVSLDDFRGKRNEFGYKCSECGIQNDYQDNYCPNCGADMKGENIC